MRSAYTFQFGWDRHSWSQSGEGAEWLSTNDGFVVGVLGGSAIARVLPEPALAPLPRSEPWRLPVPAPTGGDRYFGYGPRVYDAAEDRWRGPGQLEYNTHTYWWGDSHRERWFQYPVYSGGGSWGWALLPPKIEYPPFAEETAFRVAGTGSCLRLRKEPGEDGRILDCLTDGARLRSWKATPSRNRTSTAISRRLTLRCRRCGGRGGRGSMSARRTAPRAG